MKIKPIYKKIFESVYINWCYIGEAKRKESDMETNIHTKVTFDEDTKRIELLACPSRNEIVGGARDGKTFYYNFAFDVAGCIENLISKKIEIHNILYASKSKSLECDMIIFVLNYRKEEVVLKVFSRPAKDIEKIKITQNKFKDC
jgi:hypothetical protein